MQKRDLILFVNSAPSEAIKAAHLLSDKLGREIRVGLVRDIKSVEKKDKPNGFDVVIDIDLSKPLKAKKILMEYKEEILVVTCRKDQNIPTFAKIVPHVPYVRTPTSESLKVAVNKIAMREHFAAYDKKISPSHVVITKNNKQIIRRIVEEVGFPLVIKPANLAASLLVTICFHEEELEESLTKIFKKINKIYKENGRKSEPEILVEQFMEGEMYSIDAYVDGRGQITFLPMCHIKTGRAIGFDDFFGYLQTTPTMLSKEEIANAEKVATKAIYAIGLRSSTAHIELMHTHGKFKIIELGPRVGGFRHKMYEMSYGINHSLNDILVRIPKKIIMPKKVLGYTAAMKIFAKKEGRIKKLAGVNKIKNLESFVSLNQGKKVGEMCNYAKNGGKSVLNVFLHNSERSRLLADIRRVEKTIEIVTK